MIWVGRQAQYSVFFICKMHIYLRNNLYTFHKLFGFFENFLFLPIPFFTFSSLFIIEKFLRETVTFY